MPYPTRTKIWDSVQIFTVFYYYPVIILCEVRFFFSRHLDHEDDIYRLVGDVMNLLSSVMRQYCITMDFKFNSEKDVEYAVEMVGFVF